MTKQERMVVQKNVGPHNQGVDKAGMPKIDIIIVNYNGLKDIRACLDSMLSQSYPHFLISVVDNSSTDGSVSFIQAEYPDVRLLRSPHNLGYGGGNNWGIEHTTGDYVVFSNMDVEVNGDWLTEMKKAFDTSPSIGVATPKILHYYERDKINTCGNTLQYTGITGCRGLDQPSTEFSKREYLASVSGCSFMVSRRVLDDVGGFDMAYLNFGEFWRSSSEEVDLVLRAQLAGYKVVYVPTSVVYHKYVSKPWSPTSYMYAECGRYLLLLKNFHWKTLFAILPSLLLTEVLSWGYASFKGLKYIGIKLRCYFWVVLNFGMISRKRREVQGRRVMPDSLILPRFDAAANFSHLLASNFLVRAVEKISNWFFRVWFSLVKLWI
jgi:GT2 family glycosyltransferase